MTAGVLAYAYTQFTLFGITGLMMYWGATIIKNGHASPFNILAVFEGEFVAFFAAIRLTAYMPDIARARLGLRVIRTWLNRTPQYASMPETTAWPPKGPRDIVFTDVELRYPQRPTHLSLIHIFRCRPN